jgi:hypothetical protein
MISIDNVNLLKYNSTQKIDIKNDNNLIKVELEEKSKTTTFSGKIELDDFEKIKGKSENEIKAFEKFIDKIFSYQGNHAIGTEKLIAKIKIKLNSKENSEIELNSEENSEIEISGYWSAEETSQRILEFAKKISGNNPEKFDMLTGAFKQGFEESKKCFGGELPEVCNNTYDLVIQGFEDMKNETNKIEQ